MYMSGWFGVFVIKCFSFLSKHVNTVSEILVFLYVKHSPLTPPPPFLSGYSVLQDGGTLGQFPMWEPVSLVHKRGEERVM